MGDSNTVDQMYYEEYCDPRTHKSMILDDQRVLAYQLAIQNCGMKGKVVLDVGCGATALLSIFAAKAGARKVYAVEAASGAAVFAKQIVQDNGFEWMGACLFHEGMVSSVIVARDRHLKPSGCILPNSAKLFLAPIEDRETWSGQIDTWNSVHGGIDMKCLIEPAKQSAFGHPWSRCIRPEQLVSSSTPTEEIGSWDLQTVPLEALSLGSILVKASFRYDGPKTTRTFHGFAIWFDVDFFTADGMEDITLSTSPCLPPDITKKSSSVFGGKLTNHWGQTIFYISDPIPFTSNDVLSGVVCIAPKGTPSNRRNSGDADWRFLSVQLDWVLGETSNSEVFNTAQIEYAEPT